jgi:anaerobic magnesium-protoporphyrin IX monomethyl ester cyclase
MHGNKSRPFLLRRDASTEKKGRDKLDILLIRPKRLEDKFYAIGMDIPLGLAYLSAYLKKDKFRVSIFDMSVERNAGTKLISLIKQYNPAAVGITAFTQEIGAAFEAAREIKESGSKAAVIIGGIHASALPVETLKEFSVFDYLVYGEGEETLSSLMKFLIYGGDVRKIQGLCFRDGKDVIMNEPRKLFDDLDKLPFPDRDALCLSKYIPNEANYMRLPTTGILSTRGCPFGCNFCSKGIFGRRVRMRTADNMVDEIRRCRSRYGIKDFRFFDDNISLSRERLKKFCSIIEEKKLDISWNCYSRVDLVDSGILRMMKKAGCYHIKYGIEVGTEKALKLINKGTTLKQAEEAVRLTKRHGIECKASFMLGIPGEDMNDVEKTIEFSRKLSPDFVSFTILKPLPGSQIYKEALANGTLLHREWSKYKKSGTPVMDIGISDALLNKKLDNAMKYFYFRPYYIWQRLKFLARNPGFIKRDIKGFMTALRVFSSC